MQLALKTKLFVALQDFIDQKLLSPNYVVDYPDLMRDLETVMARAIAEDGEFLEDAIDRLSD